MKKLLITALMGIALAINLASFTGCESMSDGTKEVIVNVTKAAAKVAVRIGFTSFMDAVNETDPYRDQLTTVLNSVLDAIDNAVGADSAATAAVAVITEADVPDDIKGQLMSQVQGALVSESETLAYTTASGPGDENYGGPLYDALSKAQAKLIQNKLGAPDL